MKRRHSGLGMPPLVLAGLLLAQLVSAAPLPNAWQITDSSSGRMASMKLQHVIL